MIYCSVCQKSYPVPTLLSDEHMTRGFKHDINERAESLTSHFLSAGDTGAAPVGDHTHYCTCLQNCEFYITSFISAGKWDEHQRQRRRLQERSD